MFSSFILVYGYVSAHKHGYVDIYIFDIGTQSTTLNQKYISNTR